jgi:hypothetical protein
MQGLFAVVRVILGVVDDASGVVEERLADVEAFDAPSGTSFVDDMDEEDPDDIWKVRTAWGLCAA